MTTKTDVALDHLVSAFISLLEAAEEEERDLVLAYPFDPELGELAHRVIDWRDTQKEVVHDVDDVPTYVVNTADDVFALFKLSDVRVPRDRVDVNAVFDELRSRKGHAEAARIWAAGCDAYDVEMSKPDLELGYLCEYLKMEGYNASLEPAGGGLHQCRIELDGGRYALVTNWDGPWMVGTYHPGDQEEGAVDNVILEFGIEGDDGLKVGSRISRFISPLVWESA